MNLIKMADNTVGHFCFEPLESKLRSFRKVYVINYQMKCKYCEGPCVKAGFQKSRIQKYRCKECLKYQQQSYTYHAPQIDKPFEQVVALNNEGVGLRSMSRIMKVSCTTLLRWKVKIAQRINRPAHFANQHHYQVDEMHTFIGKKKQETWIKFVYDVTTGQVVNFHVGPRTKENLRKVIEPVLSQNPIRIGTDGLISYRFLIPKSIHRVGSKYTRNIERFNLSIRIHIKYLGRKTICFARSLSMLETSLKIYFWGNMTY